ncbi:hypothetical protein MWU59_11690 [Flavobacteriaceae bacterium F08102]|nr:hypothetical protein [Flavobacteriaceae bacterium F08102]
MEQDEILIKKYFAGTTSLEEERYLYEQALLQDNGLEAVASFAKQQRVDIPSTLEEKVWEGVVQKKAVRSNVQWKKWGIAASILLMITIGIGTQMNKGQSLAQKEALWQEALSLTRKNSASIDKPKILYEDELIVIYLSEKITD